MFFRISLAAAVATLSFVGFLAGADPAAGQTGAANAEPKTIAELVAAVKREGGELDGQICRCAGPDPRPADRRDRDGLSLQHRRH